MKRSYRSIICVFGWYLGYWIIEPPAFDPSYYLCIGNYMRLNILEKGQMIKENNLDWPKYSFLERKRTELQIA